MRLNIDYRHGVSGCALPSGCATHISEGIDAFLRGQEHIAGVIECAEFYRMASDGVYIRIVLRFKETDRRVKGGMHLSAQSPYAEVHNPKIVENTLQELFCSPGVLQILRDLERVYAQQHEDICATLNTLTEGYYEVL